MQAAFLIRYLLRPTATERDGLARKKVAFIGGQEQGELRVLAPGSQSSGGYLGQQLLKL